MINLRNNKRNVILLLIVTTLIFSISCFIVDGKLFYYGANIFPHKRILGYADIANAHKKSKAFPDCIRLQDNGLPIIAKESVFRGYANITVDTIISYGFNNKVIVAQFISTDGIDYYYVDTPFTYHPQIIRYDTVSEKDPRKEFHLKKWISNVNSTPCGLLYIRNMSFVLVILIVLVLVSVLCTTIRKHKKC